MPLFARSSRAWLGSFAVVVGCSGTYTVAPIDAGLADAVPDASMDASVDAGPPRVTPCSSAHVFCDDFDDAGPDLSMRWDERDDTAGRLVRSSVSVSTPYALGVDVGTVPKDGDTSITKSVDLPAGDVRLELDLRFTPATSVGEKSAIVPLVVQAFPAAPGAQFQQFAVALTPSGASLEYYSYLQDGGSAYRSTPLVFPEDVFRHVTMTITTANGQVTGTVRIGSNGPVPISYAGVRPTQLRISAGVPFARSVTGGSVVIDNVVVDSL